MVNKELIDYITTQLDRGVRKDDIREALLSSGWDETDVDEAVMVLRGPDDNVEQAEAPKKEESSQEEDDDDENKEHWLPVNILVGIIVVFVCMIIAGGGIYAFINFNGSKSQAEESLVIALERISTLESFAYDAKLELIDAADTSASIHANGALAFTDGSVSAHEGDIAAILEGDSIPADYRLDASLKIDGGKLYFRVDNLPELGEYDAEALEGVWYEADLAELMARYAGGAQTVDTQTDAFRNKYYQWMREFPPLVFDRKLPTREINGEDVEGYQVVLSRDNIISIFRAANEYASQTRGLTPASGSDLEQIENIINALSGRVEIRVSTEHNLPYGFYAELEMDVNKFSASMDSVSTLESIAGEDQTIAMRAQLALEDFNEPVSVSSTTATALLDDFLLEIVN